MKIRLNRNSIVLYVFIIVFSFLIINRYDRLTKSVKTFGKIINQEKKPGAVEKRIPLISTIEFWHNGTLYNFEVNDELSANKGDYVTVIYKRNKPKSAVVYNFMSFWFPHIILCLLPLIFVIAFVLSFIEKKDIITIGIGKKKKNLNNGNSETGQELMIYDKKLSEIVRDCQTLKLDK